MEEIIVTAPRITIGRDFMDFAYNFNHGAHIGRIAHYNALGHAFVGDTGVFAYEAPDTPRIIINENDYTDKEFAIIRKVITEIKDSLLLSQAFSRMKDEGITLKIHNDGFVHDYKGATRGFSGEYGTLSEDIRGTNDFAAPGTTIHISLNDALHHNSITEFRDTFVHELTHLAFAGTEDEQQVQDSVKGIIRDIFVTDGTTYEGDYLAQYGGDNILGTHGNDVITGTSGFDVIKGGAGNDFLNGKDGNDYLFGGDGSDNLVGGRGDDMLVSGGAIRGTPERLRGGSGDDLYIINSTFASQTLISDASGIDDCLMFSNSNNLVNFYRASADTMVFFNNANYSTVLVENWSGSGFIEQIVLGNGSDYILSDTVI